MFIGSAPDTNYCISVESTLQRISGPRLFTLKSMVSRLSEHIRTKTNPAYFRIISLIQLFFPNIYRRVLRLYIMHLYLICNKTALQSCVCN